MRKQPPETLRKVIALRAQGQSYKEIGRTLHLTRNQIAGILYRDREERASERGAILNLAQSKR